MECRTILRTVVKKLQFGQYEGSASEDSVYTGYLAID